jgi:hypothetical protein
MRLWRLGRFGDTSISRGTDIEKGSRGIDLEKETGGGTYGHLSVRDAAKNNATQGTGWLQNMIEEIEGHVKGNDYGPMSTSCRSVVG